MIRKIALFLLAFSSFVSGNLLAGPPRVFTTGPGVEYVLHGYESQLITNPFLWTVRAVCVIKTDHEEGSLLSFKVLRKSGAFNGENLTAGDTRDVLVHNSDKVSISAVSGAQVELINLGQDTVIAECSVT